jgi:hypothetical protein
MREAYKKGEQSRYSSIGEAVLEKEFCQSLSQKSWKVELEMESIPLSQNQGFNMKCVSSEFELQPKLTNGKIKITKLV